jgi:rare lipoprotein A
MNKVVDTLTLFARGWLLLAAALLVSCAVRDGPPPNYAKHWEDIPDAVPEKVTPSKYGNPASYEVRGKRYQVLDSSDGFSQKGIASWYGTKFHGQRTSSGEPYDMYAMTAAHKSLPLPTYVEVTNRDNGRKAIVKVNDRGPFHQGRIIDLSYAAATKLGVAATGTANVSIRTVTIGAEQNSVEQKAEVQKAGVQKSAAVVPGIDKKSADLDYISDDGRFYVQVAAYTTEKNALKMIDELREKNFSSARIHVENSNGKLLYRVRIGPVPTSNVAEKLLTQLREIKLDKARVVTYN